MSRIVLIHGFATGVRFSFLLPACGPDAGFSAFRRLVKRGEAKAFRWDVKEDASLLRSLNPFYVWDVYLREREIIQRTNVHRALAEFLEQERPETIVCHSMGAGLFFCYLQNETLPDSVRCVVFTQADVEPRACRIPFKVRRRIHAGQLKIINTSCVWDPTLWCSALLHGPRAGLSGIRSPLVEEHRFSLLRPMNLHTASIRSRRFRRFVERL